MNICKMRNVALSLLAVSVLMLSAFTVSAQVSKEEEKFWKEKANMYKKRPLSLKAEFENYQNQIKDLKARTKDLMQRLNQSASGSTSMGGGSDEVADSLRWALIQVEAELKEQVRQYEKLEEAYRTRNTSMNQGVKAGLVYRVQIGAYVHHQVSNKPDAGEGFYEERSDGYNKYLVGGFRTIDEAQVFQEELKVMGFKDAWVVPYIDGVRVSLKEADSYMQRLGTALVPPDTTNQ